jgi:hypothetical protein
MGKLTDGIVGERGQTMDLLAWCEEQNASPLFRRMERWYFVRDNEGTQAIDHIEGCDATNIRKMLDGNLQDFMGWPPARMDGYRRWLWSCAERGLTQPVRPQLEHEPA